MKYAEKPLSEYQRAREENRRNVACVVFMLFLLIAIVSAFTGCSSTVTPSRVESQQASYDGGEQNSGVIASTATGFVVTDHFRARFNGLVRIYGKDFIPELKADGGISPAGNGRWEISKQSMIYFLEMNAWRKAGLEPKSR